MRSKWIDLILLLLLFFHGSEAQLLLKAPLGRASLRGDIWAGSYSLLVIRVEFEQDADPLTTGDGLFAIRTEAESSALFGQYDYYTLLGIVGKESLFRTPQGKTAFPYYSLNEYFREISADAFSFSSIILSETIYVTVGSSMADFGRNDNQEQRLCDFVDTALSLAEMDYDYTQFDFIALLHAGVGEEFDLNGDTPNDILTTGLTRKMYQDITGSPLRSDVANGVLIIPETADQDRTDGDMPLCSLGPVAFSLGIVLGMPTTYDTTLKSSGVGMWDLMSYGFWNYMGFLPMHPSGYTKIRMGWAEPLLLNERGSHVFQPFACDVKENLWNGNHLYRVDVNEDEYFLIEYRNGQGIGKPFQAYEYTGKAGDYYIMSEVEGAFPGMLIWHVNEAVIGCDPQNLNGINGKGIDLEEADGLNDLDRLLGDTGSLGDRFDCFSSRTWDLFSDNTHPSARCDRGGKSGIVLSGIEATEHFGGLDLESICPDYFPLIRKGALLASGLYYATETDLRAHSGDLLFSIETESPLLLTDDFLVTDLSLYSLPSGDKLLEWAVLWGDPLTEAREENGYYFLRTSQGVALCDTEWNTLLSDFHSSCSFLGYAGPHFVRLSGGSLFLNGSFVTADVDDLRIRETDLYLKSGSSLYHLCSDEGRISPLGSFSEAVEDFWPLDYDGDGVTELIVLTPQRLAILNPTGPEKSFALKGFDALLPFERYNRLFLFLTGQKTLVFDVKEETGDPLTGDSSVWLPPRDGFIFYRSGETLYAQSLYDRLLRQGVYASPPGPGIETDAPDKSVFAFPNPVRGETVSLRFWARPGEQVEFTLYDAAMTELRKEQAHAISGENNFLFPLQNIPQGTYLIKIKKGKHVSYVKVLRL
ncbi:MAG TPA: hypothetical protein ENN72_07920 [Firmicutes bacterium]|nr:hypothetical protein [Bacillota bacterium]